MRILQVSSASYTVGGGMSEYVRNVSEKLARNHEVTVLATRTSFSLEKKEIINGVRVVRLQSYAPSGAFYFSWELPVRLLSEQYDVVHAHNYHAFPFHLSPLAKCRNFVVSPAFHGAGHTPFRDFVLNFFRPIGKLALKHAKYILAASEYEKNLLSRYFNIRSADIIVIPRGINFSEFRGLKKQKRDFKSVLFVGSLVEYKGPRYVIEALPKLDDDVILEIVGKGPLRNSLEQLAKKLEIHNRVRFYQNLPRRELLQKYLDSDVFVLPSRYEAFSKVVAEALALETPSIVAQTSALQEWIDDESCFGVSYQIVLIQFWRRMLTSPL
jgi:glycosyltransferase involved in cell wall biosynthesis